MPRFMWFILAVAMLIVGYLVYGKFVEKVFGIKPERATPAKLKNDGVDFVAMPKWKLWLIQLLNIAGVGPVFGPILGALYGPVALLWVVFGTIFAGAVHDYFSGMLSVRYGGANVPDIVGYNLGKGAKYVMRVFATILLLLVGVVFATAPAGLLAKLTVDFFENIIDNIIPMIFWYNTDSSLYFLLTNYVANNITMITMTFWIVIIFAYYFLATIVPIDKIIGRIYPIFGALLIIMAIGVTIGLFVYKSGDFYSWCDFDVNPHPKGLPIWPLVFITIACGALSGFHSTQSPLMARCLENEKEGRMVFYGGMVAEGFIGLVWVTVGMTFYPTAQELMNAGGPASVVFESCRDLLGPIGGILAILGVVILPITSGDTAFRACRLTIAEAIHTEQTKATSRLLIAVPVFIIGIILSQVDFNVIWRYFGWSNQSLAAIALWAAAAYLYRRNKLHWIASIPATFITSIAAAYILYEPNMGFGMDLTVSNGVGIVFGLACLVALLVFGKRPVADEPAGV